MPPPGAPPLGLNDESVANTLVPSEDELTHTWSPLASLLKELLLPSSVTVASEGIVIVGLPYVTDLFPSSIVTVAAVVSTAVTVPLSVVSEM